MFEEAAVTFVETLPHEEAMKKLSALKDLGETVAQNASVDLASGGSLSRSQVRQLLADVRDALEVVKNGAPKVTKSWTY